ASTGSVDGISDTALEKLRAQARMQLTPRAEGEVKYEVAAEGTLAQLPEPDAGDIFFDFEGDPLWTDDGLDWGLDYLWGLVTREPRAGLGFETRAPEARATQPARVEGAGASLEERFLAFWSHNRAEETKALEDF